MTTQFPKVSIGMPVYNGERFLAEAIESLLVQTFTDFELIISDNASTDRTCEICRAYAAKDPRVSYYRNEQNVGALQNFNRTFHLATGTYFMWAAHDDLRAPTFVARCVEVLDTDPDLVLTYSRTAIIDECSNVVSVDQGARFRTNSPLASMRFYDLVRTPHECYQILGMFRAAALSRTQLLGAFTSSDFVLLAELGLIGRFYEVPEALTYYRRHPQQSMELDRHQRMIWSGSSRNARMTLPQWRLFFELWSSIGRVPLRWSVRLRCYGTMLCWPLWFRNWRRMGKDLFRASRHLLAVSLSRLERTTVQKDSGSA